MSSDEGENGRHIILESGKLMGSVSILGDDLPNPMPHREVKKLIEGLELVAGLHSIDGKGRVELTLFGSKY